MKIITLFLILLIIPLLLSGQTIVRWFTSLGNYTAELREDLVPITANNFINLTESNFYDGLIFHRVVDGFVIQDGDPTGTGYGGSGTTIPLEINQFLHHNIAGTIGMARGTDPNSASSQYYITLEPTSWLDGGYAVFGYVISGMDVVYDIGSVEVDNNDTPINPVYIDSIRILNPRVLLFDPAERDFTVEQGEERYFTIICNDNTVEYTWFYDEEQLDNDIYLLQYLFQENGDHTITCNISGNYEYDYIKTWNVTVSGTESSEANIPKSEISITNYPNPFNPKTTFEIKSYLAEKIKLEIFNVRGQKVKTFDLPKQYTTNQRSRQFSIIWDGTDKDNNPLSSGIFFYRVSCGEHSEMKKCLLLK